MNRPVDTENFGQGFSSVERRRWLQADTEQPIPLLIIGGGITGAGILLDASSRGIQAILLEQADFASGTSSRSTKLIHGGLRYLKDFKLALVREVGKERAILRNNAPYLIKPQPMLLPVRQGGSLGMFSARMAIRLYELLIGVRPEERNHKHTRDEICSLYPVLRPEGLLGGITYTEYLTDDARLVMEVLKTGIQHGGKAANYCQVIGIRRDAGYFVVTCLDTIENKQFELKASQVVNASGPWVDRVRKLEDSSVPDSLTLSKGVHIVLKAGVLPLTSAVYFDTHDGRMVFAIPRAETCYVGTTDTFYAHPPEALDVEQADINYLVACLHDAFQVSIDPERDIIASWAGLRPLVSEPGKQAGEVSRKDEIFISPDGLISIAGGKLTGYRKMAEKVTNLIGQNLKTSFVPCKTKNLALVGTSTDEPETLIERIVSKAGAPHLHRIKELVSRYGQAALHICAQATECEWIDTEFQYCLQHEMLLREEDFWLRRSADFYFNPARMQQYKGQVSIMMQA